MSTPAPPGPEREADPSRADLLDRIQVRDFRLPVAPEFLGELEAGARAWWKRARNTALQCSVIVSDVGSAGSPPSREVLFLDTPSGALGAAGFVLRKRTRSVHGKLALEFELLLEARGPDLHRVAAVDVRAAPQYEGIETLEEAVLPLADPPGASRSQFSHGARLKEHRWDLGSRFADAARMFPGLGELTLLPTAQLRPVGDVRVEELRFRLGTFDFGGPSADATFVAWRDARTTAVLCTEFCFGTRFRRYGRLDPRAKLRAETFYRRLQLESAGALRYDTTKTGFLFGLAGRALPHDA